jgi:hypothetical protein
MDQRAVVKSRTLTRIKYTTCSSQARLKKQLAEICLLKKGPIGPIWSDDGHAE